MGKRISKETARELQAKGARVRKENKLRQENFLVQLVMGKGSRYSDLVETLANGEEINKPQQEFLDRMEKNFEFALPKRARVDDKGDTVSELVVKIKRDYEEDDNTTA